MRFVLFKGQSRFGSLRLHADQLSAALNAAGHDAQTLDLVAPDADDRLNASFVPRPDGYIGFGGVGANIGRDRRSVYDLLGCVYASLYLDHPVHLIDRLSTVIGRHLVFVLDRSHKAFLKAWPGAARRRRGLHPPDPRLARICARRLLAFHAGLCREQRACGHGAAAVALLERRNSHGLHARGLGSYP